MGFRRTVERNTMKNWIKSNKIKEEWHKFQTDRYSLEGYAEMQRKNRRKK